NKAVDKTGAGVGVPLDVALIAAVIYMLYLRNKQRRKRAEEVAGPGEGSAEEGVPGVDERQNLDGNAWNGDYGGYEMDGEGREYWLHSFVRVSLSGEKGSCSICNRRRLLLAYMGRGGLTDPFANDCLWL
ncbi:MAG: hypothetical protein LQ345_005132, partial [Seirophora villosa]